MIGRTHRALLLVLLLALPSCITFIDREGVAVSVAQLDGVVRGQTTRSELLDRLGPPTGVYRVRPFDAITDQGAFSSSGTQARNDEDVLVWQEVAIEGSVFMLPVLLIWTQVDVWSRTVMVILEQDVVVEFGVREDA